MLLVETERFCTFAREIHICVHFHCWTSVCWSNGPSSNRHSSGQVLKDRLDALKLRGVANNVIPHLAQLRELFFHTGDPLCRFRMIHRLLGQLCLCFKSFE